MCLRCWTSNGAHTVDRFACSYNAKLPHFNSRFYQPGAEAVDAFLQTWDFENFENFENWLVPPVSQVPKVITHLRLCKAEGTLVIPRENTNEIVTKIGEIMGVNIAENDICQPSSFDKH